MRTLLALLTLCLLCLSGCAFKFDPMDEPQSLDATTLPALQYDYGIRLDLALDPSGGNTGAKDDNVTR
jgi:hypothetical protein